MEWALGLAEGGVSNQFELLDGAGQQSLVGTSALLTVGVPTSKNQRPTRVAYEGDFSSWNTVSADAYLEAFGIEIPAGQLNRHSVFVLTDVKGMTIHVPALVLMRAFFKPGPSVFPAMFSPANIDLLSFVDYGSTPPCVVVDDAQCGKRCANFSDGVNQAKFIHWLQTSLSARQLAQSAHQYAQSGHLSIDLPRGQVRIIFHGRHAGDQLFATKANLISVLVPRDDSISDEEMLFTFHSNKDSERIPLAGIGSYQVPMHPNGQFAVTEDEWGVVEPLLIGKTRRVTVNPRRAVLDIILHKLSSGTSWKTVPKNAVTTLDVTMAFRRWAASGRLNTVLNYLQESRAGVNCGV